MKPLILIHIHRAEHYLLIYKFKNLISQVLCSKDRDWDPTFKDYQSCSGAGDKPTAIVIGGGVEKGVHMGWWEPTEAPNQSTSVMCYESFPLEVVEVLSRRMEETVKQWCRDRWEKAFAKETHHAPWIISYGSK